MITCFETLTPTDTLQRALAHVLAGSRHDFPVIEAGRLVGVLTRADLAKGLTQTGADTPVAAAMTSHFDCAAPSEMLEVPFSACGPRIVGPSQCYATASWSASCDNNVGEFLMVHSALRDNKAHATSVALAAGSVSPGSKALARTIGHTAAPSVHVGSFGMTAAAVHPRAVAIGIPP